MSNPPQCALCGDQIEGQPVDDHGVSYQRLCHDLRVAVVGQSALNQLDLYRDASPELASEDC